MTEQEYNNLPDSPSKKQIYTYEDQKMRKPSEWSDHNATANWNLSLYRIPWDFQCENEGCNFQGFSRVVYKVGLGTLTLGALCCCVPLFLNKFKDVEHRCPQCGAKAAVNKYKMC